MQSIDIHTKWIQKVYESLHVSSGEVSPLNKFKVGQSLSPNTLK